MAQTKQLGIAEVERLFPGAGSETGATPTPTPTPEAPGDVERDVPADSNLPADVSEEVEEVDDGGEPVDTLCTADDPDVPPDPLGEAAAGLDPEDEPADAPCDPACAPEGSEEGLELPEPTDAADRLSVDNPANQVDDDDENEGDGHERGDDESSDDDLTESEHCIEGADSESDDFASNDSEFNDMAPDDSAPDEDDSAQM